MLTLLRKSALILWTLSVYSFLYVPIIILVIFSFNNAPFPAPWGSATLNWYHELFGETHLWQSVLHSTTIALCATTLSLVMGLCCVYYHFHGGSADRLFSLFYANLLIPEVVLAVGLLMAFSATSIPLGMPTLVVAHTVLGMGYAIPLIYTRYRDIDTHLIEASLDLGATQQETFTKIVLPLLTPACIAAGLIVFIISFDDFLLSYFCGSSETQTLSLYLLSMLRTEISPVINALSTLLLAISSLLVLIFCWINNRSKIL